jgi:hypothetical protein
MEDIKALGPPGRAKITHCGGCDGRGYYGIDRTKCPDCDGTGNQIWRACPRCGDIAWDKLSDGTYHCRISCGHTWTEDDPLWQIQVFPAIPGRIPPAQA